jgi:hypothetical protein
MQRRDFLKYFGVGASVVPLIGGLPKSDVVAKLIEVPKADVQIVPRLPDRDTLNLLQSRAKLRMQVTFIDPDGRRMQFDAHTFIREWSVEQIDISSLGDPFQTFIPCTTGLLWTMKGKTTPADFVPSGDYF